MATDSETFLRNLQKEMEGALKLLRQELRSELTQRFFESFRALEARIQKRNEEAVRRFTREAVFYEQRDLPSEVRERFLQSARESLSRTFEFNKKLLADFKKQCWGALA